VRGWEAKCTDMPAADLGKEHCVNEWRKSKAHVYWYPNCIWGISLFELANVGLGWD
jgi:hypothetical protein